MKDTLCTLHFCRTQTSLSLPLKATITEKVQSGLSWGPTIQSTNLIYYWNVLTLFSQRPSMTCRVTKEVKFLILQDGPWLNVFHNHRARTEIFTIHFMQVVTARQSRKCLYTCTQSSRRISHGTTLLDENTETRPTVLSSGKKANVQHFGRWI